MSSTWQKTFYKAIQIQCEINNNVEVAEATEGKLVACLRMLNSKIDVTKHADC